METRPNTIAERRKRWKDDRQFNRENIIARKVILQKQNEELKKLLKIER
jgi:hypothetical protein|nr:MAG TPA: hypothetical protein [Bacteriophage sp.]